MENKQTIPGLDDDMREIFDSYIVEAKEILENISKDLIALEKSPSDKNLLNNIFRGMHTLKGTSSFLGFNQITELAHTTEDLLNKLRKGEFIANSSIIDVLIKSLGTSKILLQRIESRDLQPIELEDILEELQGAIRSMPAAAKVENTVISKNEQAASAIVQTQASRENITESTIRVDVGKLDDLMNLVGELVLARNRLSQATQALVEKYERIDLVKQIVDVSSQVDFVTTELQMAVMKTRMVPIEKVFSGLPLLTRDVMRTTGKDVDLQVYGKETELDKSIIEELKDPLVHLIRNAIDHGIESPVDREKQRKPTKGIIIVDAEREGNYIEITVEDDGCGMDAERLKQKAVEKGIISAAQALDMSQSDALNLIFIPGFSTKQEISNLSGRGVGMDVVKTNIAKLKGIVEISSEVGKGTIITMKVPLTLAIIQALLLNVGGETFAVPLNAVLEIVWLQPGEIYTIQGREVIRLRDNVLPLARMSDIIGNAKSKQHSDTASYVVIVGWAEKRIGILVDALEGQKEIVIKTLGNYLGFVPGIAGSTILGDGSVVLVIDIGQFIELFADKFGKVA